MYNQQSYFLSWILLVLIYCESNPRISHKSITFYPHHILPATFYPHPRPPVFHTKASHSTRTPDPPVFHTKASLSTRTTDPPPVFHTKASHSTRHILPASHSTRHILPAPQTFILHEPVVFI